MLPSLNKIRGFELHMRSILIFCCLLFGGNQALAWWMWLPMDRVQNSSQSMFVKEGYHPDQPIPFDHKLHAGDRKIDCQYCHSSARRSSAAGIPSMNTCNNCHKFVNTDTDNIKFLNQKYKAGEPLKWVKVHDLPDYVRFSHQPHVLAKDASGKELLNCQSCHGEVEKMGTVEQFAPLAMGWCIECHNKVKEPATANQPAKTYAPVTCNTCHY